MRIEEGDVIFKHFKEMPAQYPSGPVENIWFLVTKRTPVTVSVVKIKGHVNANGEKPLKDADGNYVPHESGEAHKRCSVAQIDANGKEDVKVGFVYLTKYTGGRYPTHLQKGGKV